jgi:putative membrane protein
VAAPPPPRRAPSVSAAPQRAATAAAYVATAAAIDLFVIRSSELALQRSPSQRVRDVASMLIADHKGDAAQLSFAGRRLNLLPSATLPPKYEALLGRLQSAADFDSIYRQEQLQVQREALALNSNYSRYGRSPTLRPVAAAAVPVIQRHLRLLDLL